MEFLENVLNNFNNSLNYVCFSSGTINSIVVSDSIWWLSYWTSCTCKVGRQ